MRDDSARCDREEQRSSAEEHRLHFLDLSNPRRWAGVDPRSAIPDANCPTPTMSRTQGCDRRSAASRLAALGVGPRTPGEVGAVCRRFPDPNAHGDRARHRLAIRSRDRIRNGPHAAARGRFVGFLVRAVGRSSVQIAMKAPALIHAANARGVLGVLDPITPVRIASSVPARRRHGSGDRRALARRARGGDRHAMPIAPRLLVAVSLVAQIFAVSRVLRLLVCEHRHEIGI